MAWRQPGRLDHHTARRHASTAGAASRGELLGEVAVLAPGGDDPGQPQQVRPVPDDRLRVIFTCCHPALSTQAQLALTCACSAACRPGRWQGLSW
jgi:RNA polymerase sigma-70 factor (ECF subfamily)